MSSLQRPERNHTVGLTDVAGWDCSTDGLVFRADRGPLPPEFSMTYAASSRHCLTTSTLGTMSAQADPIEVLRDDFRHRLEFFYARLKLAPPYHSVEKAITHLTVLLKDVSPEERARISTDPTRQWSLYRRAMVESGLNEKHRGIVAGLIRSKQTTDLPTEYEPFLDAFTS